MHFSSKYGIIASNKRGGIVVKEVNLSSILKDKYVINKRNFNYRLLHKKFSRRYPSVLAPQLLDSVNNHFVNRFVDTIKAFGKEKYLENYYSNLSNSKIINNRFLQKILLGKEVFGDFFITKRNSYLILGDEKELEKDNALCTPYHEQFHLLTTKVPDEHTLKIGFQYNNFGYGLNEGYTEYITKKYFSAYYAKDFEAYQHFYWFITMLESIVEKDKLEEYYLSADMEGLMNELQRYLPLDNVINFIEDIDTLFDCEEKLFNYQKQFLFFKNPLNPDKLDNLHNMNKALRDKIYNTFLLLNKKRDVKQSIKTNFKERNDKIKARFDKEEELYLDYFKEEATIKERNGKVILWHK